MIGPYYEDAAVVIYHADFRDVLPLLGPVHHVITDPPYDRQTHARLAVLVDSDEQACAAAAARMKQDALLFHGGY